MFFISTNFLKPENFSDIFNYVSKIRQNLAIPIGIEIFPFWNSPGFENQIIENLLKLKKYPISFHDPYLIEHSAPKGTDDYDKALNDFNKTLSYNNILQGYHIVFHQSNCLITSNNKKSILDVSSHNLLYLNKLCSCFGTNLLVENAGTYIENTMLLNQEEFENFCCLNNYSVLIDIGHAFCNNWDIEKLIYTLKTRIKAYHLHNNFGTDSHNRILDGQIRYESLLSICSKITPDATYILEYSPNCQCKVNDFCEDLHFISSYLI